jgi:hypothetical protein
MTLIIKELIIKGEVVDENSQFGELQIDEERIKEHLAKLKKEIENDCYDKILEKFQNQTQR